MNREEWDIRLLEYWQGKSLSPEEIRAVENWLGEKVENRRDYEDLQRSFLRQRWVMRERLVSRKGERRFRQVARKRTMFRRAVAVAACVSVFVLAGIGYYWRGEEMKDVQLVENGAIHHGSSKACLYLSTGDMVELGKERKSLQERQSVAINVEQEGMVAYRDSMTTREVGDMVYNKLVVNRGGEYRIVLADGSEVWVNSESELVYPVRFAGEKRVVQLKGEAYFSVSKQAGKPFVVCVGDSRITVLGTEFNVRNYQDEVVATTLVKGAVRIHDAGRECDLTPGQQAVIEADGIRVREVDTDLYTAWKDGYFIYREKTLDDIMKELSRWYDFTYDCRSEESRRMTLTAKLRKFDRVEDIFDILKRTGRLDFAIQGKNVTVVAK